MTEFEKITYAKKYISQLANGIDPISGDNISDDSVFNNVRISRCLFYVSDILQQVIANGGTVGRSYKANLSPFYITEEQQSTILITADPVGITVFAKRINSVISEAVKPLAAVHIASWLLSQGYLTEEVYHGKKRKVASDKGGQLGVFTIDVVNPQGIPYKKTYMTKMPNGLLSASLMRLQMICNELKNVILLSQHFLL